MSTGDLYLSANVSGPPYCPRGYVRKGAVGESRSQRAARKVRFSDATRLWRLITVIGPAVITTTFKDTRAVSIQKYNNSKGAHRAISLKASRSFHNGARQPRLLREWRSYSFCHPFRERKSKREREREREREIVRRGSAAMLFQRRQRASRGGTVCKLERTSDYSCRSAGILISSPPWNSTLIGSPLLIFGVCFFFGIGLWMIELSGNLSDNQGRARGFLDVRKTNLSLLLRVRSL